MNVSEMQKTVMPVVFTFVSRVSCCWLVETLEVSVWGSICTTSIVYGVVVLLKTLLALILVKIILSVDELSLVVEAFTSVPEVCANNPLWNDRPGVEVDVPPCEHHELVHTS